MWKVEIVGGDISKVEIDGGDKRWRWSVETSRMMKSGNSWNGDSGNIRNDG